MAWSWAEVPLDRVVRLDGATSEAVGSALEPLPEDCPAVLTYRPSPAPSTTAAINELLDDLDDVALSLFPAWLPGAAAIDGRTSTDVAAVRALARTNAASAADFGPFLADLAERALRHWLPPLRLDQPPPASLSSPARASNRGRFAAEVRAAGLVRVVATSYQRIRAALLVDLPEDLPASAQRSLIAAYEWFVYQGRAGVWLTGATPADLDRITRVRLRFPTRGSSDSAASAASIADNGATDELASRMIFPAIAGRPHPGSRAELLLESALASRTWATGRGWNVVYSFGTLANPVKLDLVWFPERCVVEVDGDEHRGKAHFEADRHRDVDLQLAGFAVLRFTNSQIFHDLDAVVSRIERFIHTRRQGQQEGRPNA